MLSLSSEVKSKDPSSIMYACVYFILAVNLQAFDACITLYHTIPTFNDPKKEGFGKHCGKRRKCW